MRPTGHIRQRTPGSWELRYWRDSQSIGGKRQIITTTVRGKRKDAERELRRLLRTVDTGEHVDPTRQTVAQWLTTWLESIHDEISPKSLERYSEIVENFLIPEFGTVPISKLGLPHLKAVYAKWSHSGRKDGKAGGLSASTRRYIHAVLRAALSRAVEEQIIGKNPTDWFRKQKRLPKIEKKAMTTLTVEQSGTLLAALESSTLRLPVLLALATGMRRGETLALRWRNVDFKDHAIRVVESLEQTKSGLRFKSPKTEKTRAVATSGFLELELRRAKAQQAEKMLAYGIRQSLDTLVCCHADGSPLQPRSLTHAFAKVVRNLPEVPRLRFHDLRHTHATLLLADGVHPKIAQERLGHSTISTTLDLYSHVTPTMQQDAASRLDEGLGNAISAASAAK